MQTQLLVQNYLKSGKTLEQLQTEHGVYSNLCNGKIGLNYDQLEAKENDLLAQQCRGLILDAETFDIIAYPFNRFFNMEQTGVAASVNFSTAKFLEKMDGTCCIVYFYKNNWYIGTRGRCEADANAHDAGMTFAQLFDVCVKEMSKKAGSNISNIQELMFNADKDCTYIFELTSPVNRIVCDYPDFFLTLIGVRNIKSLQEIWPSEHVHLFSSVNMKVAEEYNFNNINHMIQVVRDWNPKDHEGVVVVDNNFNRVKVKNPAYLAFNKMRDSLSTSVRGCIEVILLGKEDDIIGMIPEFISNRINILKEHIVKIIAQTEADYLELKDIQDMKEYALAAQKKLWAAPLFAIKRGKSASVRDFIMGKSTDLKISQTMLDMIFELCKKINPELSI